MDDWDDAYPYRPGEAALGHSGPGVASFVIALAAGALVFLCIVVAGIIEASDPAGIQDGSTLAIILGMIILFSLMACLCGIAVGIGGLMQQRRNKVFAVIGLVFNGLILIGIGLILLVALLVP